MAASRLGAIQHSPFRRLAHARLPPAALIFKKATLGDIEELLQGFDDDLTSAVLQALTAQQAAVDIDLIATALETGDVGKVLAILDLPETLAPLAGIQTAIHTGITAAGAAAAVEVSRAIGGVKFMFNTLNPRLVRWLQVYSLGLIREITDKTKEGVRQYLTAGIKAGDNPKTVARDIKGIIGLTDRQAQAVANYRKELSDFHNKTSAGGYGLGNKIDRVNGTQVLRLGPDGKPKDGITARRLRDFRFDGQLKGAISSGKPLSQAQIDKMVAAYQRKYLAYRARTIARTEAIRTNNMGIQDAWQQAIDKGLVNEDLVRKIWIVAKDERLCLHCAPIPSMNPPKGIRHAQSFKTPDGPTLIPPLHPNCRCTIFYRVYEPIQLQGEGQ
ncbi:Phage head morphogenesis domain containing protein [uncultured Caudovirales phage]|uniref:Phage head morphogenesis domain containing protein n=1 Tax=uncultured Caudovirales phage TaxID=2100421 RepID=A0A6J5LAJ8_9CAUD|nr:Phage head morphogenesis domain containing protein [uncultured Caudovirales phage]